MLMIQELGSPVFRTVLLIIASLKSLPGGSDGKESACNAGDLGLIPGLEDPQEKGMATHSSILVYRILQTDELGGLQSIASQRVGHN